MPKEIIYGSESQEKLKKGVDKLANAVKETLGPKGKYVVIDSEYGSPTITNDGVTVAREIEFEDKFENMGAKLIKEVSSKTEELSGDGTTTATVLTQSMLASGLKKVNNGENPVYLKNQIEALAQKIVKQLEEDAIKIESQDQIKNIATVSSKSAEIGELISNAVAKATKDGVITVSDAKGFETTVEVTKGYHFDQGYASPYMATDEKKMTAIVENGNVLLLNKKLNNIKEILHVLELSMQQNKELVIVAEDFSEEVISTIIMNKLRGLLSVILVKAPGFGDDQEHTFKDLSAILNTKVYGGDDNLEALNLEDLGTFDKIEVSKNQTVILASNNIDEYISELKQEEQSSTLEKRIAKLVGGIGVIKVGGNNETEQKERKSRIEDALQATKAAMEEGIVVGGGLALVKALNKIAIDENNEHEKIAFNIIKKAIESPIKQIAINAGHDGNIVFNNIEKENFKIGFDAMNEEYTDLEQKGIIDPKKNIRVAFENAISISSLILLTGVSIVEKKIDNK